MQPATSSQPKKAMVRVSSHGGDTTPDDRRLSSAAAISPPANGSHALACKVKNDDPVTSCRLVHRHHASESAAKSCSAIIAAPIPDLARDASRQASPTTSGMKK